jgi:hypothetical protein
MKNVIAIAFTSILLVACAPEVGTEKWCDNMDDTPKGDWSTNDAKSYAKHCVMGNYIDKDE